LKRINKKVVMMDRRRMIMGVLIVLTAWTAGVAHAQIPPEQRRQMRQEMRDQWQRMPQEDRQQMRDERRQQMPQEDRQQMRNEMRGHGQQFGGGRGGGGGRGQGGGRR